MKHSLKAKKVKGSKVYSVNGVSSLDIVGEAEGHLEYLKRYSGWLYSKRAVDNVLMVIEEALAFEEHLEALRMNLSR